MKNVSKEEYNKAVDVIYSYNEQIEKEIAEIAIKVEQMELPKLREKSGKRPRISSYKISTGSDLKIESRFNFDLTSVKSNDLICAVKTQSKHITKGETYLVIEAKNGAIKIFDNAGIAKIISRENKFKLWSVLRD